MIDAKAKRSRNFFRSVLVLWAGIATAQLLTACATVPTYDAREFRESAQALQAEADRSYRKISSDLQMKTALYNQLAQSGADPAQKALPRLQRDLENLQILQPSLESQHHEVARWTVELQARVKDRARVSAADPDWGAIRDLRDKMERSADALEATMRTYLDISKSFNETVARHGLNPTQAAEGKP